MKSIFLTLGLLATSSFALEESTSYNTIVDYLNNDKTCSEVDLRPFWQLKTLKTPLNAFEKGSKYNLRYSKFGCYLGEKGSLVIAPGRAEASPEYYETAIDFIKRGYSPVYVIDHRGQGMSPRRLQDPYKGHVENFLNYSSDLHEVTKAVQKDLKTLGFKESDNLFYTSNSMGGAIGLGYFGTIGKKSPYKAAALLGAQIRVNYLSYINKRPTRLNNTIYSEAGVIAQGALACKVQRKCNDYARESFSVYKPGSREFVYEDDIKKQEEFMTHSKARYDLKTYIWDEHDWSYLDYGDDHWISPALGGTTFSWTFTATKFLLKMRSSRFIRNFPNMPLLIMTGTNDHRAYKPYLDGSTDLSRHSKFCDKINRKNSYKKKLCSFIPLEGSFHEIYKESDEYRDRGIQHVDDFFTRAVK